MRILALVLVLAAQTAVADFAQMETLVECKSPGLNPAKPKIRVYVKRAQDKRIFAHVEAIKWFGSELRAHSLVVEKRAEGVMVVPVEYKGDGVHLVVTDKALNGWSYTGTEYESTVAYVDLEGDRHGEPVKCKLPNVYR
ncbi:MAG TPA: hypothetical protein VFV50_16015 [Bdellovibrionales bacterium]|nr:hypothetical protein [Bdellovibrionales bacterium]